MGIYSTDGGSSLILAGLGFLESGRILCGILKFSSKKKKKEAYIWKHMNTMLIRREHVRQTY
jgi:hypothetical protein